MGKTIGPPGIWIKYDCFSETIDLGEYPLTRTIINWSQMNQKDLMWELERETIETAQKLFKLNWQDLRGYKKNFGE
jgi:hypothetical protein